MKKMSVFLVLLLTLSMVLPASAQVHVGVFGGLNRANLSFDETDLSSRTAFGFGGVLDYGLGESIALHFEPVFLQKGAEAKEEDGFDSEFTFKLTYLEVPVMLKYAFGTNDTKPYVIAGPTIGFNLSAKATAGSEEQDLKDDIKSIDFGLGFGAGVSIPTGNNSIFVEARYALGLTDINGAPNPEFSIKTKGIQIFAGITFPLGGKEYTSVNF